MVGSLQLGLHDGPPFSKLGGHHFPGIMQSRDLKASENRNAGVALSCANYTRNPSTTTPPKRAQCILSSPKAPAA